MSGNKQESLSVCVCIYIYTYWINIISWGYFIGCLTANMEYNRVHPQFIITLVGQTMMNDQDSNCTDAFFLASNRFGPWNYKYLNTSTHYFAFGSQYPL